MKSDKEIFEYCEQICRIFDGNISPEEVRDFEHKLSQDPELLDIYTQVAEIHGHFICPGISIGLTQQFGLSEREALPPEILQELLKYEEVAPEFKIPQELPVEDIQKKTGRQKIKKSTLFLYINIAAVVLIAVSLHFLTPQKKAEIVTLADSINAKWTLSGSSTGSGVVLQNGERFNAGDSLQLEYGIAEFVLDNGAKFTLEAPAKLHFLTEDQVELDYGRLYAIVPVQAIGFTVNTPNSRIIDLGTEFGVETDPSGVSSLHVINGRTTLIAGSQKTGKKVSNVSEGMAFQVGAGSQVNEIKIKENLFARDISSKRNFIWRGEKISLANIIMGGSGFSGGNIEQAVSLAAGQILPRAGQGYNSMGNEKYLPVNSNIFIDGVFIPDGARKTIVSSYGNSFDGFPETSGKYWSDITANPQILIVSGMGAELKTEYIEASLENEKYSGELSPRLIMNSNAGITFSLDAIREANPGFENLKFQAECGVISSNDKRCVSEFWVLVDGKAVFHAQADNYEPKSHEIEVQLSFSNKFLTLAITDGGDGIQNDRCVFVKPELIPVD